MPTWKRVLLKSIGIGAGFALVVCAVIGTWLWYNGRPKTPKPWNSSALKVTEPPSFSSFSVEGGASAVKFTYSVQNNTDTDIDYEMAQGGQLKVLMKLADGTVSEPVSFLTIDFPVFIPARRRGTLTLSVTVSSSNPFPERPKNETDDQYHERLRAYLEKELPRSFLSSFVIYDESNRYEVDLPRNSASK